MRVIQWSIIQTTVTGLRSLSATRSVTIFSIILIIFPYNKSTDFIFSKFYQNYFTTQIIRFFFFYHILINVHSRHGSMVRFTSATMVSSLGPTVWHLGLPGLKVFDHRFQVDQSIMNKNVGRQWKLCRNLLKDLSLSESGTIWPFNALCRTYSLTSIQAR